MRTVDCLSARRSNRHGTSTTRRPALVGEHHDLAVPEPAASRVCAHDRHDLLAHEELEAGLGVAERHRNIIRNSQR
jgi:hypothetical protein